MCEYGHFLDRDLEHVLYEQKLAGLRFARIWQERSLVHNEKREREERLQIENGSASLPSSNVFFPIVWKLHSICRSCSLSFGFVNSPSIVRIYPERPPSQAVLYHHRFFVSHGRHLCIVFLVCFFGRCIANGVYGKGDTPFALPLCPEGFYTPGCYGWRGKGVIYHGWLAFLVATLDVYAALYLMVR